MAVVITILHSKGGVGKTTTTYNLASGLALANKKVLMIDVDSVSSLSKSAGFSPDVLFDKDISAVIDRIIRRKPVVIEEYLLSIDEFPCLHLLPSTSDLSAIELRLVAEKAKEKILERIIKALNTDYDYILIDCPPNVHSMTTAALTATDKVIIPCAADFLAYEGLPAMYSLVEDVKELLNSKIEVAGVIVTRIKNNDDDRMISDKIGEEYKVLAHIKECVDVKRAVYTALPVVGFTASKSKIVKEIGAEYQNVCDMILNGEI